jgi:hypothetical protein
MICLRDEEVVQHFVGNPEENGPLGRSWRRWENNVKINLEAIRFGVWIRFIWLWIVAGGGLW